MSLAYHALRSNKRDASAIFATRLTRAAKMDAWKLSREPPTAPQDEQEEEVDDEQHEGRGYFIQASDVAALLPDATQLPGILSLALLYLRG